MSSLASLGLGSNVQEEEKDTLGGYSPLESGVYKAKLGICYVGKSAGGATSVTIQYSAGGRELRETQYITSKSGKPTYERDGKLYPLPGYSKVNALLTLATGKGIAEQSTEKRAIKLYNAQAGKEILTEVECLVDAIGAELALGIIQYEENKSVKVGNEYKLSAETRTGNEIDTAFNLAGLTHIEAKNGATAPEFLKKWKERHEGNVVNRVKKAEVTSSATTAAPAPAASAIDFG